MKTTIIIAVMAILSVATCTAQTLNDKVYFDEDWNIVAKASDASYYRLYNAKDKSAGLKPYKDYYIDGRLQGEGFYSHINNANGKIEFVEEGEQKNYYDSGKLRQTWTMKMGKIDGEDISYYESGSVKWRMNYIDGYREGTSTKYNDTTGTIDMVLNYKNGHLDGKQIQYDPLDKGTVWKEEHFNKGLMEKEITYGSDGNVRKIFTLIERYKDGFTANETWYYRMDEDSLASKTSVDFYYDFDPDIWQYAFSLHYVESANFNGEICERHGKYQTYDRKNRVITDGHYNAGEKDGIWKRYDYKQKVYCVKNYDEKMTCEQFYTFDNEPYSGQYDSRYHNGQAGRVGLCKNGLQEGLWTAYDDKDRKDYEHYFKNGKPHGKVISYYYDDNGELYFTWTSNYVDGKLDGVKEGSMLIDGKWEVTVYTNYKNGEKHGEFLDLQDSIFYKGNYKEGYLDGEFIAYYIDGDNNEITIRKGNYRNGKQIGEWYYYYHENQMYSIVNYDDDNIPNRYYNLNHTPYTGTLNTSYTDDDGVSKPMIMFIKNSFIQQIQYPDPKTGEILSTWKFKNGLPIEE